MRSYKNIVTLRKPAISIEIANGRRMMQLEEVAEAGLANAAWLDQLFEAYQEDQNKVSPFWKNFFENLESPFSQLKKKESKRQYKHSQPNIKPKLSFPEIPYTKDARIYRLIETYRTYGHMMADFNPIRTHELKQPHEFDLERLGFSEEELNKSFPTYGLVEGSEAKLVDIIEVLRSIYCDRVGVEYMGLQRPELERWLQERIEPNGFKIQLGMDQKQMILHHLNKSELFESFLHTKYVGQKRFSLEGGETLIPMLEAIIETGANGGMTDIFIGMAHRGRLNVLTNILNKSYSEVFNEFDESYIPNSFEGSGDVKYHKGYISTVTTSTGKKVNVTLADNPSHLESIDGVVEGQVRARQVALGDDIKMKAVVPVLIHGDASLSGQGVVYEVMQMYKLSGYCTGGTLHFVINNQIGFTTIPKDSRSTRYCTDIARTFSAPVFHVNAEDPEGCIYATKLAMEIRQEFHCDVFVELNCYRKFGHNEGDEPAFTQPKEYELIAAKSPIRELYLDQLMVQGILDKAMAEKIEDEFKKSLHKALQETKNIPIAKPIKENGSQSQESLFEVVQTGVPFELLKSIAERCCFVPSNFHIHKKLERLLEERLNMVQEGPACKPLDWGMAETLAYGTLLWEGKHVRISGQDSRRGTFSHRHAMWVDQKNAKKHFPLSHLKPDQGRFDIFNSPLSEYGVLGFEFGYSLAYPKALVIWEAQFGDFTNGAQIIIDQFFATSEQKWGRKVGLTLFLPHGYEGQGPEHSSARIERFMGLAGNYNMQIVYPTTPAQFFHLLRRQVLKSNIKPLVIFTPKGLLRHPDCVSTVKELTQGSFQEILDDPKAPIQARLLMFCSGRIYYDIASVKEKNKIKDVAIIRIEQLYPLHLSKLKAIIGKYKEFTECFWVQEEPSNMGAWKFMRPLLKEVMPVGMEPKFIGRAPSASPSTGSHAKFKKEYNDLMNAVLQAEAQPFFEASYEGSTLI